MKAFEGALAVEPMRRATYLRELLPDDDSVRAEVEGLLELHDHGSPAVGTAAGFDAAATIVDADREAARLPKLRGNYRILRTIGEGGMGVVFEAEQEFPRRRVAIKTLRPGFASLGMLRRFRSEAEFLGQLQHPNIAQIYEAGVSGDDSPDQPYFVMELIEGETLGVYLKHRSLTVREKWSLLLKVCDAVHHAHQRGVIHRDLKPGNVLVTVDGEPKVVDFGIARAATADPGRTHVTGDGQVVGTPSYMAPELLLDGQASVSSEIYAIGVIAYEMFTGRLPVDLSSAPIARAGSVLAESSPVSASRFERALRGDGETIIAKAMAKEASRRYASAGEFAEDIRRMLSGDAIIARRDSAVYVLWRQMRRHRTAAALALLGLAGVIAFAVYATISERVQRDLAEESERAKLEAVAARDAAQTELVYANIERGRMAAAMGALPMAEDILWTEYLRDPSSVVAYWGLWDLYEQTGSRWVTQAPARARAASIANDGSVVALVGHDQASELRLFDGRTGATLPAPEGTPGGNTGVAVWPDGSKVLLGTPSSGIHVVTLRGEALELRGWPERKAAVRRIDISEHGTAVAAVSDDGVLRLWDGRTGELRGEIPIGPGAFALDLNPQGTLVAAMTLIGTELGVAGIWDALRGSPGEALPLPPGDMPMTVMLPEDESLVYLGHRSGHLTLLDRGGGEPKFRVRPGRSAIGAMVLSPSRDRLLTFNSERLAILDARTGALVEDPPDERFELRAAGWVGEREIVAVAGDGAVRGLGVGRRGSERRFGDIMGWNFSGAYSDDGALLAVGTSDSTIDVYDAATLERLSRCEIPGIKMRTRGVEFLPGGRELVAGSQDGAVRVIESASGRVARTIAQRRAEIYSIDVSPDATRVAVGYADTRAIVALLDGSSVTELPAFGKRIEGIAFSPDGGTLAISSHPDAVVRWDLAAGAETGRFTTTGMPWGVVYSPDGSRVYVTTYTGAIEVFDAATRERVGLVQGHQRLAPGLAVSPDGSRLATAGEDGLLRLWDTATLRGLMTFRPGETIMVTTAFNPAGDRVLATTSMQDLLEYDLTAQDARIKAHEAVNRARVERSRAR